MAWCLYWILIYYITHSFLYIYIVKLYRDIGAIVTQSNITSLMTRFLEPTWGPSGADRTQVGPMLAPSTLLSGTILETAIQWTLKNIGQISRSQWTPHSLPGRASYGVSVVHILKIDHVLLALNCMITFYSDPSQYERIHECLTLSGRKWLTHWRGQDKMAATFAGDIFKCNFFN